MNKRDKTLEYCFYVRNFFIVLTRLDLSLSLRIKGFIESLFLMISTVDKLQEK